MKTSYARLAAVGAAAALATTGAVAAAAGSSAAVGVPTMAHESAGHSIRSTSSLRVAADPGPCAHVPAGKLSSVVSFHRRAEAAPTTYAVTAVAPTTHRHVQTRSVRVGPGVSTLQMVWNQQHDSVGSITLSVKDAHGKTVATVHEHAGGSPVAARCA